MNRKIKIYKNYMGFLKKIGGMVPSCPSLSLSLVVAINRLRQTIKGLGALEPKVIKENEEHINKDFPTCEPANFPFPTCELLKTKNPQKNL